MAVYKIAAPEKTAPLLRDGLKATDALIAKVEASGLTAQEKYDLLHELRVKRVQFNDALVQALGISCGRRWRDGRKLGRLRGLAMVRIRL